MLMYLPLKWYQFTKSTNDDPMKFRADFVPIVYLFVKFMKPSKAGVRNDPSISFSA